MIELRHLRQVGLGVRELSRAVAFYRDALGMKLIAEFSPPGLAFFQLGATRLVLSQQATPTPAGILYFEIADIEAGHAELVARGVVFDSPPRMIHRDDDGRFGPAGEEEWMSFFKDPDGNQLALAERRTKR